MRITKSPDSSLNESKFSDINPNPKHLDHQMSISFKPNCYYHPDQIITNFCRSSACLLPLCPECVRVHALRHKSQGTHGEFDTIDHTVSECFQEMMKNDISFKDDESNFKDLLKLNNEYQGLMMQKLMHSKAKLIDVIESYYNRMAIDLEKRIALQVHRTQNEIYASLEKLKAKKNQNKEFMENLKSSKILKTTIHLLSSTFFADQLSSHREFQSLFNLINSQKIDIQLDDNMLHNINCNLIKYINVLNSDLYKYDDMKVTTQKVTIQQQQQPIYRSQSPPPVIMGTSLKSPQKSQTMLIPNQSGVMAPNFANPQQIMHVQSVHQNMPLGQSKIMNPNIPQQHFMPTMQYQPNTVNVAPPPQSRPLAETKISSATKIHKVNPSIPGDPIILDFNKDLPPKNREIKENVHVSAYLNSRQNAHLVQVNGNSQAYVSRSPVPVKVRSVSPTTKIVKIPYGNVASSGNMNLVYLENEERPGFLEVAGGIKNTHKKK